jgi:hypothetical protein
MQDKRFKVPFLDRPFGNTKFLVPDGDCVKLIKPIYQGKADIFIKLVRWIDECHCTLQDPNRGYVESYHNSELADMCKKTGYYFEPINNQPKMFECMVIEKNNSTGVKEIKHTRIKMSMAAIERFCLTTQGSRNFHYTHPVLGDRPNMRSVQFSADYGNTVILDYDNLIDKNIISLHPYNEQTIKSAFRK